MLFKYTHRLRCDTTNLAEQSQVELCDLLMSRLTTS